MKRKYYEATEDYKRAVSILTEFVDEVLDGDINKMRNLCFADLNKYIGDIHDPDMYLITQAIYIILWGDVYDLTFEKMGAWDEAGRHPFRGDTMNSFGSLFGKEQGNKPFGYRAKYHSADENEELWSRIEEFHRIYHKLGNFIVIPNRGSCNNGINGARGNYFRFRDYFDQFLLAIADYQDKTEASNQKAFNGFDNLLKENPEYSPEFLKIEEWKDIFFLNEYFDGKKPKLLFNTPPERRMLKTAPVEMRETENYYQDEEYLQILDDYLEKSVAVIESRTNTMVDKMIEITANHRS